MCWLTSLPIGGATRARSHASRRSVVVGLCLLVGLPVSACTTVHVVGGEPTKSRVFLGALQVRPTEAADPITLVSIRGFGLVPGMRGVTLGYRAETWAVVQDPNACRIVVFGGPPALTRDPLIQSLAKQMKDGELCLTTEAPGRPG